MKNKLRILSAVLLIILIISGCSNAQNVISESSEISPPPAQDYIKAYKSVLQNKSKFFSFDAGKELDITQLNQAVSEDSSITAEISKLTVIDLDGDDVPEVVLSLTVNADDYFGSEILRYHDGMVYGYTLWYRSFMDLKEDGTFSFSGGASDSGFGTIQFTEDGYTVNQICYSESSYDADNNMTVSYYIDGKSVTSDEFMAAVDEQNKKAGAEWYDFTDENINTLLSDGN